MRSTTVPTPRLAAPQDAVTVTRPPLAARVRHRLHRVVLTLLFASALGGTLLVSTGTSQEATAATNAVTLVPGKCDVAPSGNQEWNPSQPGAATGGFLYPAEYITEGSAKTPLEKYGMRGMTWSMTSYSGNVDKVAGDDDQNCSFMAPIQNMLAIETLSLSQSIASVTIAVRQQATDAAPFMEMARDATPDTDTALRSWFIPAAVVMVIATGIWTIFKSTGGARRTVISGVAWMMGALFIVTWLMSPTSLANGSEASGCEGRQCELEFGSGEGTPEGETPIRGDDPNYYALTAKANDTGNDIANAATGILTPEATSAVCNQVRGAKDEGARTLDCVLWYEMAFRPWATGQFGSLGQTEIPWTPPAERDTKPPDEVIDGMSETKGAAKASAPFANEEKPEAGDDVRMMMLAAQTFSWQEAAATGMASNSRGVVVGGENYSGSDNRITPDADAEDHEVWDVTTKNGSWNQVRAYMAGEAPRNYGVWSGQEAIGERTSTALLTLIGNILIAVFVLVTSLLTLMWYTVVVLTLMALPFVGLISIFPPAQKFLRGLGQLWLKGLILAALFTVLQVGIGAITGFVMGSNAAFGWKVVLLLAAVLALFKVAKLAREDAFTPNLNSQGVADSIDPQQGVNRVSPVVAGAGFAVGRGSARVAGRGAKAAGRKTRDGAMSAGRAAGRGVEKGKGAAHRGAVKARGTRPGRAMTAAGDNLHDKAAAVTRTADRKMSGLADHAPGGAAARGFNSREEKRDAAAKVRSAKRGAREKESGDLAAAQAAAATKRRTSARAGRERMARDEVEVAAEAPPTQPRVTRVNMKRPVQRPGGTSGPAATEQPRAPRRTSAGPPRPTPTPQQRGRTGSGEPDAGRTSQPKVQRQGRSGTRLSPQERRDLARETAKEVGRDQQKKIDRDRAGRGGGGRVT